MHRSLRLALQFTFTLCAVWFVWTSTASASSPRILYTDLLSAPATGGEAEEGAFVTLYGIGFGSEQKSSRVTLAEQPVYAYPIWTDTKIVVQIGQHARSGNLVVTLGLNINSNGAPFTVRAGRIYFVSPDGEDLRNGTFRHPWKTLAAAKDRLRPGDVLYAMSGIVQDTLDRYDSALSIQTSGASGAPISIVSYPGATVILGAVTGPRIAARTPNIDRVSDHWVIAGLIFHGAQQALDLTASTDWRIIANDFSCPEGFGPTGCVEASQATNVAFLGNTIHDVARLGTTKTYHALYFSTDSNHIDLGWNTISDVRGCRAIQFHSTPIDPGTGRNQFDLHIHDNTIHDVVCDGINLATVDASKGTVEVYNNLIYNVGTGPDPEDGSADYACIYVQGGAEGGLPGSGTVHIYNNTLYHCGARRNTDSGAFAFTSGSPEQSVQLTNNIVVLDRGVRLYSANSPSGLVKASNNVLWHTDEVARKSPIYNGFVSVDPLLDNPCDGAFELRDRSPAISSGVITPLAHDIRGLPRDPARSPDLGAFADQSTHSN